MASIKIGFSRPKKFTIGSWAIQTWMRKPYSHTYIRIKMNGKDCVYEASHGSVHFSEYKKFAETNLVIKEYEIDVSDKTFGQIKSKCLALEGEEYSILQLSQVAFWDICNALHITAGTEDKKGYICSELVGRICVEDLKIDFDKVTWLLTPSDVDNKLATRYLVT